MWTDWKIDVATVDSIGDPLYDVMHPMGTDLVTGWNTACYTSKPHSYQSVHGTF